MRNEYAQETALVAEEEKGEEGEGEKEEKSREGKREEKREGKRESWDEKESGKERKGGRKVCSQTWLASKSTEQLVNRMLETPSNLTSMARMQHVTFLRPLLPTGSLF